MRMLLREFAFCLFFPESALLFSPLPVPLDKGNADSGNEIVFSWIKLRMPTHGNRTIFDSITCNYFSKLSKLNSNVTISSQLSSDQQE